MLRRSSEFGSHVTFILRDEKARNCDDNEAGYMREWEVERDSAVGFGGQCE